MPRSRQFLSRCSALTRQDQARRCIASNTAGDARCEPFRTAGAPTRSRWPTPARLVRLGVIHGNCLMAAGKLLLSDPFLPSCAGRVDPRSWAVDEGGAADGLREAPPDWLAAHGARHHWEASLGEFVDRGVELRADTSATIIRENGHLAEVPVGHWCERERGRPHYLTVGDRDPRALPGVVTGTRQRYAVDHRIVVTRCSDLNIRFV